MRFYEAAHADVVETLRPWPGDVKCVEREIAGMTWPHATMLFVGIKDTNE